MSKGMHATHEPGHRLQLQKPRTSGQEKLALEPTRTGKTQVISGVMLHE